MIKLKEKLFGTLIIGGSITLIFWVILGLLYLFGTNGITWWVFVRVAGVFFGWAIIVMFLINPIMKWLLINFKNKGK